MPEKTEPIELNVEMMVEKNEVTWWGVILDARYVSLECTSRGIVLVGAGLVHHRSRPSIADVESNDC